ncbi:MAG: hypothetical protein ACXW2C_07440, partial [Acidimicrobiia bacterium]
MTGTLAPDLTVERLELCDESWVDVVRGFVADPTPVFRALRDGVAWKGCRLWRYEKWVDGAGPTQVGGSYRA